MSATAHPLTEQAGAAASWRLSLWAVAAAFGAYFCMYAFRKPFTAATFDDMQLWGLGYKSILVTAQILGYTASKFIGIKVIAEMPPHRRTWALLSLVGVAEVALLLFGLVPPPYNFVLLFFNGLPLGMVFGLVLGFLEGRRLTEALMAGLCASFILADGATRSVGAWLLYAEVPEYWMPAAAGALFVAPLVLFTWMLGQIPPPTTADVSERCARPPMSAADRWRFFTSYAPGLSLLILAYVLVTVLRSVRSDFAPELWSRLGLSGQPNIFAQSEIVVGLTVMLVAAATALIRHNRLAFFTALGVALAGLLLVALALNGLQQGWLSAFPFMVLIGLGLYLPYVVVHTTVFERLIAMTRQPGNLGYLMYLADAFGYLGYVAVMFARSLMTIEGDFLQYFVRLSWTIAGVSVGCLMVCWLYFLLRTSSAAEPVPEATVAVETT